MCRWVVVQLLSPFKLLVLCERITLPLLESGMNGVGVHPPWRLDCALGVRVGEGSVCWDVLGVRTTRASGTGRTAHHGAGTPAAHILAPCPTAATPTRKLPSPGMQDEVTCVLCGSAGLHGQLVPLGCVNNRVWLNVVPSTDMTGPRLHHPSWPQMMGA